MEEFFQLTQGDMLPSLRVQAITRIDGRPVPLPGLTLQTPVTFSMWPEGDAANPVVDAATATVEDAPNAILRYDWDTGNTDADGHYVGAFVLDIEGKPLHVPNNDVKIKIRISE